MVQPAENFSRCNIVVLSGRLVAAEVRIDANGHGLRNAGSQARVRAPLVVMADPLLQSAPIEFLRSTEIRALAAMMIPIKKRF
jgi:hypothetical protein